MIGQKLEQAATTLRDRGKGREAAETYQQAKSAYLEAGETIRAAGMQHMTGVAHKIENDIGASLRALNEAISEYESAGDALGPGRVERDIGIMFEYRDQLDEAWEHLQRSKRLLTAASPEATTIDGELRDAELGITLAKLGLVSIRYANYEEAEQYIMDGLLAIRKAGHPFYEMTSLMHLASVYFATEHYGRMLANLEAALGLIYEYDMQDVQTRRLAQIWGLMAHGYLHCGNRETAVYFAQKSFAVINELSDDAADPVLKDIQADTLRETLEIR